MELKYPTTYSFEVSGRDLELNYIELIDLVASMIDNDGKIGSHEANRVRKYGIQRFKDITKVTW